MTTYTKERGQWVTTPMDPAAHGRESGAAQHRRRGERPCPRCLAAQARAQADRRAARRLAMGVDR